MLKNGAKFTSILVSLLVLILVLLAFILDFPRSENEAVYLTPVSLEAAEAFSLGGSILTEEQAVLAARKNLTTSRMRFAGDPLATSVELITYDQAFEKTYSSGVAKSQLAQPETLVWLVILKGSIWIDFCPEGNCTPEPNSDGCAYVILNALDGSSISMGAREDCTKLFGSQNQ